MRVAVVAAVVVAAASAVWLVTIEPDAPRGPIAETDWIMPGSFDIDRYPPDDCHPDVPGWQTAYRARAPDTAAIHAWYRERHGEPLSATDFTLTYGEATVMIGSARHVNVRTYASVDHICPPRGTDLWDSDPVTGPRP